MLKWQVKQGIKILNPYIPPLVWLNQLQLILGFDWRVTTFDDVKKKKKHLMKLYIFIF